ncbi:hypothetical protein Gotur_032803, partial [Gossypium turneri]
MYNIPTLQYNWLMWLVWQKEVEKLLKGVAHEKVAELQVSCIPLPTISAESLEKTRDAHLVVVALIATVAFLTGITVPGGLNSEKGLEQGTPYKGSKQGTPLFIHEAASKAFVVTNALAFLYSVFALTIHFGVMDNILSRYSSWHRTVLNRTQIVSGVLGHATIAMVIAFSTGSYV